MISLIICSRNTDISSQLRNNIDKTIGLEYELIVIDNSQGNHSIFSAYNSGVNLAKYPFICFMHDDILYHTPDWGKKAVAHFQDNNVGIIGVIGCHYYPAKAVGWWYYSNLLSGQVLQRVYQSETDYYLRHLTDFRFKVNETSGANVVAVDGLWIFTRKKIFDKIRFDENLFDTGWHGYDIDLCFQALNAGFCVHVVFDILIEHFSNGSNDVNWLKAMEMFQKKWISVLPLTRGGNQEADMEFFDQLKWELSIAFEKFDLKSFSQNYYMISRFKPEYLTLVRKFKSVIIHNKLLWSIFMKFREIKKKIVCLL